MTIQQSEFPESFVEKMQKITKRGKEKAKSMKRLVKEAREKSQSAMQLAKSRKLKLDMDYKNGLVESVMRYESRYASRT